MKRLRVSFCKVDLHKDFSEKCKKRVFDTVYMVEVIKHLENPRHTLRQIKSLLKDGGITFCFHADASCLYSRRRFFFAYEMAMFTGSTYYDMGHIMSLTS